MLSTLKNAVHQTQHLHKKPYQSPSSTKITPRPHLKRKTCNKVPQNAMSSIKASGIRLSSWWEQFRTPRPLRPVLCPLRWRPQKSKSAPSHLLWLQKKQLQHQGSNLITQMWWVPWIAVVLSPWKPSTLWQHNCSMSSSLRFCFRGGVGISTVTIPFGISKVLQYSRSHSWRRASNHTEPTRECEHASALQPWWTNSSQWKKMIPTVWITESVLLLLQQLLQYVEKLGVLENHSSWVLTTDHSI